MPLSTADWAAISLSLQLATVTTCILLLLGTPLAWWLARTGSWLKGPVAAIVALPLVLPPTVLGFYLLMAMSPTGPVGRLTESLRPGNAAFHILGIGGGVCVLLTAVRCAATAECVCSHRATPTGDGRNPSGGCLGSVFPYCSADGVARVYLCQCIGLCAYARGIWSGANDWGQYSRRNPGGFGADL